MEGDVAAVVDVNLAETGKVVDLRDHLVGDGTRNGGHRRHEVVCMLRDGIRHQRRNPPLKSMGGHSERLPQVGQFGDEFAEQPLETPRDTLVCRRHGGRFAFRANDEIDRPLV